MTGREPMLPAELDEQRRRLNLSELVRLLVATMARTSGDHSTVELARSARGEVTIKVSVRTGEPGVETAEQASAKATELFEQLDTRYPFGSADPAELEADKVARKAAAIARSSSNA